MSEEWRPLKRSKGQYEISNRGRVRNVKTGRILKGFSYKTGAKGVRLGGYINRTHTIAQLVAEVYITDKKCRVYHKKSPTDDRPENLFAEELYD